MTFALADFLKEYHIQDKKIAVGVSGGSDSMALIFAAHEELSPLGWEITALTVDHQLRPESAQEAEYVAQMMKAAGIKHHILVWDGEKPVTGIEEAAREARYGLIGQWCRENDYHQIMLAHHRDDQAETFFIRLQRGSGLDGLCGMHPVTSRGGLTILRPLLNTPKIELKTYLQNKNIKWVEDQSNYSDVFLRCRIRKLLEQLKSEIDISLQKIADTMKCLQNTQHFLDQLTRKILANHFCFLTNDGCYCDLVQWNSLPHEIRFRLFGLICRNISSNGYIPRAKRILALLERLNMPDFKSATLGGCKIQVCGNLLWIFKEAVDAGDYSREAWEKHLKACPELQKLKIPYKMRVLLLKNQ